MSEEFNVENLVIDVVEIIDDSKTEICQAIDIIKQTQFPKGAMASWEKLSTEVVPDVVEIVEAIGKLNNLTGEEKKALVCMTLDELIPTEVLNKLIDIPLMNEWMEGKAIDMFKKQIIGVLVEGAVKIFNSFWKKEDKAIDK